MFYLNLIKRNRLDVGHDKYCNQQSHRLCGAIWGHADIMREIISRICWWFTGQEPFDVSVSRKPKPASIIEMIGNQRKREEWQKDEIEDVEYDWLMNIINRCTDLLEANQDMPKSPNC